MISKYIAITFAAIAALFTIAGCGGWNEGSGFGECTVAFVSPLYSLLMSFALFAAFTAIVWVPAVVIIDLVIWHIRSRNSVRGVDEKAYSSQMTVSEKASYLVRHYAIVLLVGVLAYFVYVLLTV